MICRYCGTEFEPKKRGRKNTGFCSKHCADNWRRHNKYELMPKKYTKTCAECGSEYQTNREEQKYCSRKCSFSAKRTGRTVHTKVCQYCGRIFQTVNKNGKYCTSACTSRDAGEKRRGEYFCEYCGKPRWSDHPKRNRFCSRECATKMRNLINLPAKAEKERLWKEKHRRKCPVCGKEFVANTLNRVYCSSRCLYTVNLKQKRDEYAEEYEPVTFTCAECGKSVTTRCGDKHRVYCSNSCMNRAINRQQKMKREEQIEKAFVESVKLREIYDRDNGICRICGLPVPETNESSNQWAATVDHIYPLSKGGLHKKSNCQLAHRLCNSIKQDDSDRYPIDWRKKVLDEPGRWDEQLDDLWQQLDEEALSTG